MCLHCGNVANCNPGKEQPALAEDPDMGVCEARCFRVRMLQVGKVLSALRKLLLASSFSASTVKSDCGSYNPSRSALFVLMNLIETHSPNSTSHLIA